MGVRGFFALLPFLLPMPLAHAEFIWQAELGGDVRWFDWREHEGSKQLLMEQGPVASAAGKVLFQKEFFYTSLAATLGAGITHYDGHLQSPSGGLGPVYEAPAFEQVLDTEWQIGLRETGGNVHIGLIRRDWHRMISGSDTVSSAEERYRWLLMTVGGEVGVFRAGPWQAALAMDVGFPVNSWEKVYSGFYGNFELEPGAGVFFRLGLPLRQKGWLLQPYYQQQGMLASRAVMRRGADNNIYLLHQPESVRREIGLTFLWQIGLKDEVAED